MIEIKEKSLAGYKFIDLFAGLGGFRLALESLGAKCVYSSEWEKSVASVYEKNFGDVPDGDITKVEAKDIPDHDILCAGFPCQAFSISGSQRGFDDSRGTLFFDVARIVAEKKPSVVFMENVKNFASHDGGHTLEVVRTTMEQLGYTFNCKILNAADYGVPQRRERIYMVCFRDDLDCQNFSFPQSIEPNRKLSDILLPNNQVPEELFVNRDDMVVDFENNRSSHSKSVRLGIVNKGGQGERIYSTSGIAITLSAFGGGVFAKTGGYLVDGRVRKLHKRECARLMGFPDSYIIDENRNKAYMHFGNSVVVDVLQYIAIEISKSLETAGTKQSCELLAS